MVDDPIVAEVRKVREQLLAEFDYDIDMYVRHIKGLEEDARRRGVRFVRDASEAQRTSSRHRPNAA